MQDPWKSVELLAVVFPIVFNIAGYLEISKAPRITFLSFKYKLVLRLLLKMVH